MTDMNKWDHKDEWHRYGKDFLVAVKRHTVVPRSFTSHEGPNRWAVYAYIYPNHRLFGDFHGPDMWQPAAFDLPLHGGPSFLQWHRRSDGNITSVQIGADYAHLHDDRFTHYATANDASEVFADADRLFEHLEKQT